MQSHSKNDLKLGGNLRMTKQRQEVYDVLLGERDHPTAAEVYDRAKEHIPGISLATVYNCLETLTEANVVKQVNMDRGPARYCPNLKPHAHFHCQNCGGIIDIDPVTPNAPTAAWSIPEGHTVCTTETVLNGTCSACANTN